VPRHGFLLCSHALGTSIRAGNRATAFQAVVDSVLQAQAHLLFICEIDVTDPDAHRRNRDAHPARDHFDRLSFLSAEPSRQFPLSCFHE
jgi:hypothetical protein